MILILFYFHFQYADSFEESRVDGDLLLQLSEDMLREDIEMRNGTLSLRIPLDILMSLLGISSENCKRRSPSTRISTNK